MLVLYFKHATIKLYLSLLHVGWSPIARITGLSRYKMFKLLAETYFNGSVTQASADVAPLNIKSRNLFENVETGIKMMLSSAILFWTLVMNHGRRVVPFSDWLT